MALKNPIRIDYTFILSPQYFDLETDTNNPQLAQNAFVALLQELNGMELEIRELCHPPYQGKIALSISNLTTKDLSIMSQISDWALLDGDSVALRAKATFIEPEKIATRIRERGGRFSTKATVRNSCENILVMLINKLFVLMSCYLPGSSDCRYGYPTSGRFCMPPSACRSSLQGAALRLTECGISPVPEISFGDFVSWSRSMKGFWLDLPDQPVARALNFISYLHHHTHQLNNLSELSWVIAALEAILTENNSEVRSKFIRRSTNLVPALSKMMTKKEVANIYDFRSRFLHGDLKISNHFYDDFEYEWDGWQFVRNFDSSAALLVKCLHTLAERNWTEVQFTEVAQGTQKLRELR